MNNSVPLTEVGTRVTIEKVPARAPVFKSLVNTTSWRLGAACSAAALMLAAFLPIVETNMYHFVTSAILIVSHAML